MSASPQLCARLPLPAVLACGKTLNFTFRLLFFFKICITEAWLMCLLDHTRLQMTT